MSRSPRVPGTLSLLRRVRAELGARRDRRALAHELAGYATPAQRAELELLIEATGAADDVAARVLRGQARAQLFRIG